MSTIETLLTAEEFAARPAPCDDSREELVEGRVVVAPPPGAGHGGIGANLSAALTPFVRAQRLGRVLTEAGYLLSAQPDTVRAPDVSFVSAESIEGGRLPDGYIRSAPDLAVEIVSPGDRAGEINRKVAEYLEAGSRRVWVVWPETRTVTVHQPGGSARTLGIGDILGSDDASFSVEGFQLPVAEIFA